MELVPLYARRLVALEAAICGVQSAVNALEALQSSELPELLIEACNSAPDEATTAILDGIHNLLESASPQKVDQVQPNTY